MVLTRNLAVALTVWLAFAVGVFAADERPASKPAAAKTTPFSVGQRVEVKKGGHWDPAVVTRKQNAWTLITYDRSKWREWVEPWRIRKLGASEDNIGFASW